MAIPTSQYLQQMLTDSSAIVTHLVSQLTAIIDSCSNIDTEQYVDQSVTQAKLGLLAAGSSQIANLAVTVDKCAANMLTADATGLTKMQNGYFADSAGARAKFAAMLTLSQMAASSGIASIVLGNFTPNDGIGDNAMTVATGHATDIVFVLAGTAVSNNVWLAIPGLTDPSDVWSLWLEGAKGADMQAAFQQDANGFTILSGKCDNASEPNDGTTVDSRVYISIALA